MSKKRKEALIFVVNIGKTTLKTDGRESFLEKSKTVIRHVMERKIFIRKGDLINVICIGANETNNKEGMDYINQLESELLVPTWDLVRNVLNLQGTNRTSVWVEGLHVALEFIKQKCLGIDVIPKVMVINDFQEDLDIIQQFDAVAVAKEVMAVRANLLIIGKTPNDEAHMHELNLSERLALKVCKMVDGDYEQIDKYMWVSRFYQNPPVKPNPWKCELRIGDIRIPTESYVKITEPPPFPSWKLTTRDSTVGFPPESAENVQRAKELIDRERNVIDPADAIKGFKYGGKFIPFSEEDLLAAKFEGTKKSMIVRGFVKREDVSLAYWFGKGSHIIVSESMKFHALLTAMKKLDRVAIVRKVYQMNAVPKMGVLFPRMEEGEPMCLVHINIPFAEERRVIKPNKLVSLPMDEQQRDVKDFIHAMTLPADSERFKPGSFCNPCKQNKWDNLAHRALNRVPLPPMDKALVDLISPHESMLERAEPVVNRLAKWVKPKLEVKQKEVAESLENNQDATQKTDEELIRAAEEAEEELKKKEELFGEISEASINFDDDLLNEM